MTTPDVRVLADPRAQEREPPIGSLIDFLGLTWDSVGTMKELERDEVECVAIDSECIETWESGDRERLVSFLSKRARQALLYGLRPGDRCDSAVHAVTKGAFESVRLPAADEKVYRVSDRHPSITRQFSGLTFGPVDRSHDLLLTPSSSAAEIQAIVSLEGGPLFASLPLGNGSLCCLATRGFPDLNDHTPPTVDSRHFSRFIPAFMFFRHVFGDRCWRSPGPFATVTIDDPFLRLRYGLLDFRELAGLLRERDFTATVAFIPWNYKRSEPEAVALFQENADRLSLCVHGCDHTEGEFGETDRGVINGKVRLATSRMVAHQKSTGLPFDRVMIFPQGVFSTAAMASLQAQDYVAAVNSHPWSVPQDGAEEWTFSELLDVAVLRYDHFPLFLRRDPVNVVDFALDAFLQRPVLICTHHECLSGADELTSTVDGINRLEGRPQWRTLGETLRHGYTLKVERDDTVSCRLYSREVRLTNPYPGTRRFRFSKSQEAQSPSLTLRVDDREGTCETVGEKLEVDLDLEPGESATVRAISLNPPDVNPYEYSRAERFGVYLRRRLSEFRDDHLSGNPVLLSTARTMKNGLFAVKKRFR